MARLLFRIAVLLLLSACCTQFALAQEGAVTLYSSVKYKQQKRNYCLDFTKGVNRRHSDPCDLQYGMLYAGDDWDWFQSSTSGTRSVIRDLGPNAWNNYIKVPVVLPLAKLGPGENRSVTIDVSGADGAPGAPGARGTPALPGAPGRNADGTVNLLPESPSSPSPIDAPEAPKKPPVTKPKVDPFFVKAVVGHMYVIRIVDETRDFYVLFRVEALERGDNVSISWKIVAPPEGSKPADR